MSKASIIRDFRKHNGLTQEAFANLFGTSSVTISRWETGKNTPPLGVIVAIEAIGMISDVEFNDLLHRTMGLKQ